MMFENFLLSTIEWLKNIELDQVVYGQPGKITLWIIGICIWIYIASWMYKDASYRYLEGAKIKYLWLILGVLFAPIAWFFYIVFRPSADLDEMVIQQAEERYLAFESRGLGYCAKCGSEVDPDFMYCSHCGVQLRNRCKKCESLVEKTFLYCPRCGQRIGGRHIVTVLGVQERVKAQVLRNKEAKKVQEKKEPRVSGKKRFYLGYFIGKIKKTWVDFVSQAKKKKGKVEKSRKEYGEKVKVEEEGKKQEEKKSRVKTATKVVEEEKKEEPHTSEVEKKRREESTAPHKVIKKRGEGVKTPSP